jgi:hypothetical protein
MPDDNARPPLKRQERAKARLSAALRENLKRRKAQARGRAVAAAPPAHDRAPPAGDSDT